MRPRAHHIACTPSRLHKGSFLQRFLWASDFNGLAVAKPCRKIVANVVKGLKPDLLRMPLLCPHP